MGNKIVINGGTSKELSARDLALLKGTSKLSEDEIREIHKAFWTDFPSGRMDKKGFIRYYERIKDVSDRTNVLCDHIFAVFDQDHNGTIDFYEFLLTVATGTPVDLDSHLEYVFEMCDVSGDGQMDLSELAAFLSASLTIIGQTNQTGNLDPKKLASDVFGTLGVSVDQKLNKEQFINGCKRSPKLRELLGGGK